MNTSTFHNLEYTHVPPATSVEIDFQPSRQRISATGSLESINSFFYTEKIDQLIQQVAFYSDTVTIFFNFERICSSGVEDIQQLMKKAAAMTSLRTINVFWQVRNENKLTEEFCNCLQNIEGITFFKIQKTH